MSRIGTIAVHDNNIDANATDLERKRAEVVWKVKVNDSKVEAAAERGAKKCLISTFDDSYTNKLKHPIKSYAGITYFKLTQHTRKNYRKLHQLNISELLHNMASYFDINEGFTKHIERMKDAQKLKLRWI